MIWLEGLLLASCAATIAGSDVETASRTVRTLIAGAVAASLVAVEKIVETFLLQPSTGDALACCGATRIGIHMPDVNAVGSMYALFACRRFWLACSRSQW